MSDDGLAPGRWRIVTGAVGTPLAFGIVWALPLSLDAPAHRLAAIFAAVIVAWVTEVIPIAVTALLIAPAMIALEVCTTKVAFAPYADPLLYLFVGGFIIARSMSRHGLDKRLAMALVASAPVAGIPSRVRIALVAGGFLLTMWISNTAAAAIVIPIVIGMAQKDRVQDGALAGTILAVVYCCSLGGLGTPVGSPPNLITLRLLNEAGIELGFVGWMQIGLPVGLLGVVAAVLITRRAMPAGREIMAMDEARAIVVAPWSRGERVTLAVFAAAVLGWTVPGILQALGVTDLGWAEGLLDGSVVALLCAAVLFAVPDGKGARVMDWEDAVKLDWGVIVLFGGGIALGQQMFDTGLSETIGRGFVELTGVESLWTLTVVCAVIALVLTEACSNTATATMLVPLVIGMAQELDVSPIPPVLAVGLASSCGFMLPIATGPNAIGYATGRVSQRAMIGLGITLDLICLVIILVMLRVLCPLYGWT